ncbi:MAG: TPM domain-containing protein [Thermodesulfobacteriota bacterium]
MNRCRPSFLLLCLALWLAATAAWAEVAIPPLTSRVTDLTATLSEPERAALESELRLIEEQNGSQVAVLLVPSTQPEGVEQYALRVVEAWKLGQKGKDNGLLLLVAKNDRKLRIEVGYGLEGVIPDAIAKRIIAETIAPRFKQGDFGGGLLAGVGQIKTLLAGEPMPAPPARTRPAADDSGDGFPFWLLVALPLAAIVARWLLGPLLGGLTMGSAVGIGAWLLSGSLALALVGALVAFVVVLAGLANWISLPFGGSYSSGGGGFSGGDDSFSGGGGDFGGGGASGDW